ncbi:hypothetical protein AABB24_023717 [Solanum stoloniferum]|uniref:Retrotransposon Copia-like N-terminal domain-containing protein n=1 Tax=Solanum stoloniferum TaxID=62892 RepID=A0ABD2SKS7_9SOLN
MVISEGINSGSNASTAASREVICDSHHPLYLQSSDTPGSSLVSLQLTGSENYSLWSKSMKIGLLGKGKIGFVNGTSSKDKFPSSLHTLWEKCNAIVLSWIMIYVSRDLLSGIVYASSAQQVWIDLKERFDKVDGSRIFYLHKEIATLSKGISSISTYYSRLKELWMEFDSLMPVPGCTCTESQVYAVHFEYQRLMQFLLGLNESYNQCRSQIMMMDPAPSVNKAYSLVISEESQRILGKANSVGDVSPQSSNLNEALAFFNGNNTHQSFSGSTTRGSSSGGAGSGSGIGGSGSNFRPGAGSGSSIGGSNFRPRKSSNSHLYCDYCNWKGHIRAQCYKLHGYLADWKGKRRSFPSSANLIDSTTSTSTPSGGGNSTTGVSHAFMTNIPPAQPQPHPHFSHQQYMQILQLLDSGHGKTDIDSTVRTTGKLSTDKWIIDSGASKHMVHNLHKLT